MIFDCDFIFDLVSVWVLVRFFLDEKVDTQVFGLSFSLGLTPINTDRMTFDP